MAAERIPKQRLGLTLLPSYAPCMTRHPLIRGAFYDPSLYDMDSLACASTIIPCRVHVYLRKHLPLKLVTFSLRFSAAIDSGWARGPLSTRR